MAQIRKQDLLDVSTRLGGFVKPVLLVWGAADRFFKLSLAERLTDTFADARLVTVPDARTFVALDAPERLADEIASLVHSG
jgi:pimeloyl-ACP methyl ester carboxylesterase